jgi:hypothetical protein
MVSRDHALSLALEYLRKALALLDQADAPAQIGAHVDLAAVQLQEVVGHESKAGQSPLGNC